MNAEAYIDLARTRDVGALRLRHSPMKISLGNLKTCMGLCYRVQLWTMVITYLGGYSGYQACDCARSR